jgi:hypothetical protein
MRVISCVWFTVNGPDARGHSVCSEAGAASPTEREGMTAKTKGCRRYRVQSWQGVVSVRVKGTEAA